MTAADIKDALRRATLGRKLSPVYCGSAPAQYGRQPLLTESAPFFAIPRRCQAGARGTLMAAAER